MFLIAQTALGSCNDNVLEGFSKVLLAVRDHQMVDGIRSGRVDAAHFHRWAGSSCGSRCSKAKSPGSSSGSS
ncbi:hypothetical protein [Paracidovorax cattleyae]|uniref:hypothetical protein n=1 Tax=Paracidovorax cattleyae TaxID=80868 RepID=UPI001428AAC8|nr:hypothetical protein [Paracidovorax cattleyae]